MVVVAAGVAAAMFGVGVVSGAVVVSGAKFGGVAWLGDGAGLGAVVVVVVVDAAGNGAPDVVVVGAADADTDGIKAPCCLGCRAAS